MLSIEYHAQNTGGAPPRRGEGGTLKGRKGLPARHPCSAVVEAAAEQTGPPMRMQTDGTKR